MRWGVNRFAPYWGDSLLFPFFFYHYRVIEIFPSIVFFVALSVRTASAYMHVGNGSNIIYVDEEHDLVIVARWIENNPIDGFIIKVLDAMK